MKNPKSLFITIIPVLTAIFLIAGCDMNNNGNKTTSNSAQMTVQLTDAPASFDAVNISIKSIQVKSESSGWITLNDQPEQVNLLDLSNGNTIQIGREKLAPGVYNQLRLILGQDNSVVVGGKTMPLKTPSAQQSGLKLQINAQVEKGEIYNLLIDFDAARSIVVTGSGKFILKPVLHVVRLQETGSISGIVQPDSVQTTVSAIANMDTLSTLTDTTGSFKILGVGANTYHVTFNPAGSAYSDTTITDITVKSSEDVNLGTITLPQQ